MYRPATATDGGAVKEPEHTNDLSELLSTKHFVSLPLTVAPLSIEQRRLFSIATSGDLSEMKALIRDGTDWNIMEPTVHLLNDHHCGHHCWSYVKIAPISS